MDNRNNIEAVNDEKIESWKKELAGIPKQIGKLNEEIIDHQLLLRGFKRDLAPIQTQIEIIDTQLSSLRTQLAFQTLHQIGDAMASYSHDMHDHYHHHHHHHGLSNSHVAMDSVVTANLTAQISQLDTAKIPLVQLAAPIKVNIDNQEKIIGMKGFEVLKLQEREKNLHDNLIPDATNFLEDLRDNPEQFFRNFCIKILNVFKSYHKDHYHQQTKIRLCLNEINKKLLTILEDEDNFDQNNLDYPELNSKRLTIKKEWQLKFLQLIGFLWDMKQKATNTDNTNIDSDFTDAIWSLLRAGHIDDYGDLPNEMKTGNGCVNQFRKIENKHFDLFNPSEEYLLDCEEKKYRAALKQLNDFSKERNDIKHNLASQLATEVDREMSAQLVQDKKNEEHRKKTGVKKPENELTRSDRLPLYTRVLVQGHKYFSCAPNDPKFDKIGLKFGKLGDAVDGTPSTTKKVFGVMSLIGGLALIGFSVAGFAFTLGGSSFLSALGVAGGFALLGASGLVGSGFFGFGIGLFESGKQKGTSKVITQINDVMQKEKQDWEEDVKRPAFLAPNYA